MNYKDFEILIASYGADLMRWPEPLRSQAAPLFTQRPLLVQEACNMDDLLDSYKVKEASAELLETIMDAAIVSSNDNTPTRINSTWQRLALLAACAIIGFWCGTASLQTEILETVKDNGMKPILLGPTRISEVML